MVPKVYYPLSTLSRPSSGRVLMCEPTVLSLLYNKLSPYVKIYVKILICHLSLLKDSKNGIRFEVGRCTTKRRAFTNEREITEVVILL